MIFSYEVQNQHLTETSLKEILMEIQSSRGVFLKGIPYWISLKKFLTEIPLKFLKKIWISRGVNSLRNSLLKIP